MKKYFLSIVLLLSITGCMVSTQDIKIAKQNNIPLVVSRVNVSHPNSAGGVDVRLRYLNTSNKSIKYIVTTVVPYNKVGDRVSSEIGNKVYARLQDTGPIKPDAYSEGTWSNNWYNYSIRCTEITNIDITYMDGTREQYKEPELSHMIASDIKNNCKL